MRAKVLQPCCADGITVLSGDHERRQLDDAWDIQPVRLQQGNDVGENLVRLFREGGRSGSIGSHTHLSGKKNQFRALGNRHRVAIEAEGRMYSCRI